MSGTVWDGPRFRPPAAAVLLVPVVLSFLVQVPAAIVIAVVTRQGVRLGLLEVVVAAIGPLALLASRRFPGPTVAVVAAAALGDLLIGPDVGPPYVAIAFAIALAVARGALPWALVSVGTVWLAALLLAPLVGLAWPPPRIAFTTVVLALCFGIGWFARTRRQRAIAYREDAARRRRDAEEAERLRVANELHDVLGHSLSLINVQAGVALHLLDRDPEHARGALEHIKAASRAALDEVRGVLGIVRGSAADDAPLVPQQGLADLARLFAGVRSAGLRVEVEDPAGIQQQLPPWPVQAAAYRIVQEALTNVLRHAGASRAVVTLAHELGELRVDVEDDGRGIGDAPPGGGRRDPHRRPAALAGGVMIRVALADDQHLVRAGFRALLEAEDGIRVVGEAAGGTELLALLRREPVDVVLMDIRMPDGDGLWATERIAADPALAGVRVVIVTTFELDDYVVRAVRAGASGFLVKDTEPADLVRAVRAVADGDALLSPGVTRRLLERLSVGLRETPDDERIAGLTEREREVLRLVGGGLSNAEIAAELVLSPLTAKTHVSRIMQKLDARDRVRL
ncbi:MAG: response regulator, partial [Microbacteriaceae bacterium]|nr:response regulator [Microbacteriaceae bacterium]